MEPVTLHPMLLAWQPGIFGLIVYTVLVSFLMIVLMLLSRWLGQHHPTLEKSRPYESGIIPTGAASLRFPVPFFLAAIFFLLFDLEGVFIFSYAVAADVLGWVGMLQIGFFIAVLIAGWLYLWVKGGFEWGPNIGKK